MKLLADEGVDKPIVDALRNAGFDVVTYLKLTQVQMMISFYHWQIHKEEL